MARDISVSISVQGEREYRTALKDAQSAVKLLDSELKASEAAFDGSANAQEHYANKTRLIGAQIEQQKTILKSLEQAVKEAGKEFGESSAKTDYFRIEVNKTHASIAKLERAFRESEAEMAELGRDSGRVGRQLEQGIGEAADDVGRKFDQMVKKLDVDLSEIGSATQFSALIDGGGVITGTVQQVIDGIDQVVESTEDYRRRMSFLEQNAITAGLDPDELKAVAMKVASITGDMDGAIEGVSNLAAAGLDMNEIATAADRLVAAAMRWPETLKFESMADGLQESIATKNAVGQYAEMLTRLGLDLETVNEAMNATPDANAAQTAAMAWMTEHGLDESLANYLEMNEDLVKAEAAQLKYNDALAKFAEALVPVQTEWNNFKSDFLTGTTELIDGGFDEWIGGLEEKLRSGLGLNEWMQNLLGDDLYKKLFEEGRDETKTPAPGTASTYTGAVDPSVFAPDTTVKPGAYAGAVDLGETYGIAAAEAYTNAVKENTADVFDVSDAVEDARASLQSWEEMESGLTKEMMQELLDKEAAAKAGEEAGDAGVDGIGSAVESDMPDLLQSLETDGKNAISGFADGILASSDEAVSAANTVWNLVNARLSRPFSFPSLSLPNGGNASGQSGAGSAAETRGVALYLDGRELGRTSADYISAEQGARVDRYETYGY